MKAGRHFETSQHERSDLKIRLVSIYYQLSIDQHAMCQRWKREVNSIKEIQMQWGKPAKENCGEFKQAD